MEQRTNFDNQVVYIDNKKFRKGYTTGSCATAAAKVAACMILEQKVFDQVSITTPSGVKLDLDVLETSFSKDKAVAAIKKDGGDDADVTTGLLVFAEVIINDTGKIVIDGGEGVGRVTRKGVRHEIGAAAINATPQKMIEEAVREVIGEDKGAKVVISVPGGEEVSAQTYNPRLGIMGGISILGTTGIVTPMSEDSWKVSISLEMEMKKAEGLDKLIFVPGNHGETFAQELNMDSKYVVVMSNFVRFVLKECERIGFSRLLLLGHFGKLVKIAAGVFHTHSHIADARLETVITCLALMGAPKELLQQIDLCKTTEAAMELIDEAGYQEVYEIIAKRVKHRAEQLSIYTKTPIQIDAILCAMDGRLLGTSADLSKLQMEFGK